MTSSSTNNVSVGHSRMGILLFAFAMLLLTAVPALADDCVADLGGVLDGFVDPVPPSQIQIDGNCTIRNFPASNPLTSNFSFYTQPGQNPERWLVVFDNVVHTGQMACSSVLGHRIWFVNGSSSSIQEGCQNLLIPVEKIDKRNPPGQTTATIGVPFTYTLTIPVLFDPATGTVINSSGSPNDVHSITIWDDLNQTGANLSYVSHNIYWLQPDGTPGSSIAHTFSNVNGVLTFGDIGEYDSTANAYVVHAGDQIVIELTVVLDDSPANVSGTQFINTAKWEFGRYIDGVFYIPLPGEWGVTQPMTIAAPNLVDLETGGLQVSRTYRPVHNIGLLRYMECSALGEEGEPEGDIALWKDVYFPYDPGLKNRKDLRRVPVQVHPELSSQEVVETYAYDAQGLIRVEIENRTSGYRRLFNLGPESHT